MSSVKEAELLSELKTLKEENKRLKDENISLRLTLDDFGIEDTDIEDIPDAEIIAIKQLEILRSASDNDIPFEKEDADIFKILTKALIDIRGGSIKRPQKTAKGKDADADEIYEQFKKLKLVEEK